MRLVQSAYNGNDDILTVIPSGDWHIGHANYREDIVKSFLSKLTYNTRGLLTGDLLECATKDSVGKGLFDTKRFVSPKEQKEYLIELLRPYAQFIDGAVVGNHEHRIEERISLDIMEDCCRELKIPYLKYTGIVKYAWNKTCYTFALWHGSGGGSSSQTAIKTVEDMANKIIADVYCIGHFHKILKSDRIMNIPDTRNNVVRKVKQYFVVCGSALDYNEGYAEMKGLKEVCLGYPIIELTGDKHNRKVVVKL